MIEKNYFCERNIALKDSCTEMSYEIIFIRYGIKELYLQFNFPIKFVKRFAENLTVSIDPKNGSDPYFVRIKQVKAMNSTTIRLNFTVPEEIYGESKLIISPLIHPIHDIYNKTYYDAPYTISTISTLTCDEKCPPNASKGISSAQAAMAAVSSGMSSGSSIAMGMNFAAVWTLGSLMQFITLFSLINIPVLPKRLLDFYNGMGLANLNFIPNIIKVTGLYDKNYIESINNTLRDNARYHSNIF